MWFNLSGKGLLQTDFRWVTSETYQHDNAVSTGCEDIPRGHKGFSGAIKKRCTLTNEIFPKREAWSRFLEQSGEVIMIWHLLGECEVTTEIKRQWKEYEDEKSNWSSWQKKVIVNRLPETSVN